MRDLEAMLVLTLARHVEVEETRIQAVRRAEAQAKRLVAAIEVEAADRTLRQQPATESRTLRAPVRRVYTEPTRSLWQRAKSWFGLSAPSQQSVSMGQVSATPPVPLDTDKQLERLRQVDAPVVRALAENVAEILEMRCAPAAAAGPSALPTASDRQLPAPAAKHPAGRWGSNGHD